MVNGSTKYTLADIKKGMRVFKEQVSEINGNIINPVYDDSTDLGNDIFYEEAVKTFLEKMNAAEDAVARGEYKASAEVHKILGV